MPVIDVMPEPAGAWWMPARVREYLTYRRILGQLSRDRSEAGWNTSGIKAGQLKAEARTTAQLIMEARG
jgi:hypothetical protein